MNNDALKLALEAAYLAGFNASAEGYNAEYPFEHNNDSPDDKPSWCVDRDNAVKEILSEQDLSKPVAWELGAEVYWNDSPALSDYIRKEGTPLYTTPQTTWVPLTDYEILSHSNGSQTDRFYSIVRWAEEKLKEKNNSTQQGAKK
jgi:hypothetical protein